MGETARAGEGTLCEGLSDKLETERAGDSGAGDGGSRGRARDGEGLKTAGLDVVGQDGAWQETVRARASREGSPAALPRTGTVVRSTPLSTSPPNTMSRLLSLLHCDGL